MAVPDQIIVEADQNVVVPDQKMVEADQNVVVLINYNEKPINKVVPDQIKGNPIKTRWYLIKLRGKPIKTSWYPIN